MNKQKQLEDRIEEIQELINGVERLNSVNSDKLREADEEISDIFKSFKISRIMISEKLSRIETILQNKLVIEKK